MRETRPPHRRLVDLIHPTRVAHHESGEEATTILERSETVDDPVTHRVPKCNERRPGTGDNLELVDINRSEIGPAPELT